MFHRAIVIIQESLILIEGSIAKINVRLIKKTTGEPYVFRGYYGPFFVYYPFGRLE